MEKSAVFLILMLGLSLGGCATASQPVTKSGSQLTQRNVQTGLVVGKTTKAEVLEIFGAPNSAAKDDSGRDVWTYRRGAQVSKYSDYWIINFGDRSSNTTGFESGYQMITLLIMFDNYDVVTEVRNETPDS